MALYFPDTGECTAQGLNGYLNPDTEYTVAAWVYRSSGTQGFPYIIGNFLNGGTVSQRVHFSYFNQSTRNFAAFIGGGFSNSPVPSVGWNLAGIRNYFSSGSWKNQLYINGSWTSENSSGSYSSSSAVVWIGRAATQTSGIGLAEISVWNRRLSDREFSQLSKNFSAQKVCPSNLVFYIPGVRNANSNRTIASVPTGNETAFRHSRRIGY